jgi:hypothetical protein
LFVQSIKLRQRVFGKVLDALVVDPGGTFLPQHLAG